MQKGIKMQLNIILNWCIKSLIIVESFVYIPILAPKLSTKLWLRIFFAQYYTSTLKNYLKIYLKETNQMLSKGKRSQQISVNNLTRNPSIFTLFKLSKTLGNMSPHTFVSFTFVSFCDLACSESSWFPMTFSDSIGTSVSQFCWGISVYSSLCFSYIFYRYTSVQDYENFSFFRHFSIYLKISCIQ